MITIYGIKNCDTMKKAFAWLEANGVAYQFVDYKKAGVVAEHLPHWAAQAGWQRLLNTKGLMWKKLSEEQRANVDEAKALALLNEFPSMIKRPVLVYGTAALVLVGFDADQYTEQLAQEMKQ